MAEDAERVYVVIGADSGLGLVVANRLADRLEGSGRVITCGVGTAVDVQADLTVSDGRAALIRSVLSVSAGHIDGVIAVAGSGAPRAETVSLNYFSLVRVLEGLRSALAASDAPAVVVVSSSSSLNRGSDALVRACEADDERRALATARRLMRTGRGSQIYRSSKIALNRWIRATSVKDEWASAGIVLNAVAPGIIATEAVLRSWDDERALLQMALPQPLGSPGPVSAVADLLIALVEPWQRFTTGQVIFADGGTDALTRKQRPIRVYLRYSLGDIIRMAREARRIRLRASESAVLGAVRRRRVEEGKNRR